jgi:hypothetical protein
MTPSAAGKPASSSNPITLPWSKESTVVNASRTHKTTMLSLMSCFSVHTNRS